ncbi:MAG: hypothetical protein PHP50_13610 [Lachnospiraceae bacterium]|nr:hypothetical protein [Lachnospiraceae bacterium]
MTTQEFIHYNQTKYQVFCSCILSPDGTITECKEGHLKTLMAVSGIKNLWNILPGNASPLFWIIIQSGCVAVDFENQLYNRALTGPQKDVLEAFWEAKIIMLHPIDLHDHF